MCWPSCRYLKVRSDGERSSGFIIKVQNIGLPSPEKLFAVSGYFKVEDEGSIYIYSQYGYLKTADTKFYFFSHDEPTPHLSIKHQNLERVSTQSR